MFCHVFLGEGGLIKVLIFSNCMDNDYIAWRIAMGKVWGVPLITHCNLLPHLSGVMGPEL